MMRPVAIGIAFAALFLASAGSCAPESAEGTKRKSGAERLVKKNGAARMKAEQEIQRFRDGEPFHGDVSAFTAPDAQAIDLLAQELRNNPKPKVREQVVKALVPMAEMLNYAAALRAMTQGRSDFNMEFSHYEEAPRHVQEKIIADAARQKKEEAEG